MNFEQKLANMDDEQLNWFIQKILSSFEVPLTPYRPKQPDYQGKENYNK